MESLNHKEVSKKEYKDIEYYVDFFFNYFEINYLSSPSRKNIKKNKQDIFKVFRIKVEKLSKGSQTDLFVI